jgi:hypothetical protein
VLPVFIPSMLAACGEWAGSGSVDEVAAYIQDGRASTATLVWDLVYVPVLWLTVGWIMGDWREVVRRYKALEEEQRAREEEDEWVDLAGVWEGVHGAEDEE